MDKFNGFSQDEINSVEKKINMYINKPRMQEVKRSTGISEQRHTGIGIRRVPDKRITENNNNNHNNNNGIKQTAGRKIRKATGNVATASVNSAVTATTTTKTMKSLPKNVDESSDASTENMLEDVSVDRSMSKSIEEALFFQPLKAIKQDRQVVTQQSEEDTLRSVTTITNTQTTDDDTEYTAEAQIQLPPGGGEMPFKGVSLKEFEVHRKLIEEQNNQKKRMLCKAIELHSEKTAAEARKIQEIKTELAELDNKLSVDVGILRKQIEAASAHYANVEKQYIKIEAQFLKSKMELHQAAEKKELLTEHLCTVIAHNEDRKAEKLSELMLKVGLTPSGDFQTRDVTPSTMQI